MGLIANMQKKNFDLYSYIGIKKPYLMVFGISIIGLLLSIYYKLTMDKDAWFWFFSSLAQTFAALIALAAIFLMSKLESYNTQIHNKYDYLRLIITDIIEDKNSNYFAASDKLLKESFDDIRLNLNYYEAVLWDKTTNEISYIIQKKEKFKNNFRGLFASSLMIVMYSLILLPLGSVDSEKISILYVWNCFKLKWFFIYLVVGHCIIVLYQVAFRLSEFFDEDG